MEKSGKKLIPYSVYLHEEYYDKIRELAKQRKASGLIRTAIEMILDGDDTYKSGYNKAIKDSCKVVDDITEIEHIAIRGHSLKAILSDYLTQLRLK